MSVINYAAMEINIKIVYYGPGLCGKTTNLNWIYSKTAPSNRGKLISLATEQDRTLFFDFFPFNLGKVRGFLTRFHLYTVPGQVYYDATRKMVLRGLDGVVFVADSLELRLDATIESFINLQENLSEQGIVLQQVPFVIQYNKRDLPNILSIEELENEVNIWRVPSFEAVATKGIGVQNTLKRIGKMALKNIET